MLGIGHGRSNEVSEFYNKIDEMQKKMRVSNEMEKLDDEYRAAYETANEYLQSCQDERSDILTIDMHEKKINFGNQQEKGVGNAVKKVREKSRECHNHKPQPFPDPKRKPTNLNKHKPSKRTKSTKISSLFPKRGNRNTKTTEKHKNKMTHGKTYNKSPRRINHKATKSKTNTGTTALERSVEQTTGEFKALLQLANFTLGADATFNTEIHKNSVRIKVPNSVNASKRKHKNQINHYNKQRRVLMANSTVCQSK